MKINYARYLNYFCFGLLLGVGVGSFLAFDYQWSYHFLLGLILISIWSSKKTPFLLLTLAGIGFLVGNSLITTEIKNLSNIYQGEFSGAVKITKEPDERNDYLKVVVAPLPQEETTSQIKKRAVLFLPLKPSYHYGEVLKLTCQLEKPKNKHSKFNYQRFLAKNDIYQICAKPKIERMGSLQEFPEHFTFTEKTLFHLLNFKHQLEGQNKRLLPQPESAYLAGLLLGGDNRLPQEVADNFRLTGTTHVVAVSGSNIAIIAQFLIIFSILIGFSRPQSFGLVLGGIWLFVIIVGMPASAVRAGIMGTILITANQLGRLNQATRSVLIASALMTALSPFTLIYDAGFQLSVLATLGIIWFYQPLKEKFAVENDFLELKSIFLITVAAQIGVFGLIIYLFELFPLLALPANLLIIPAIPLIMLLGIIMNAISFIYYPLAQLLAYPVYYLLHAEIKTIEILSSYPQFIFEIKNIHWFWLIFYYGLLVAIIWKIKYQKNANKS